MVTINARKSFYTSLVFILTMLPTVLFAQRTNFNEDDVVMMNTQKSVGQNIMHMLENKQIDSALALFKNKDAATKKQLQTIATAIQKFKGKYELDVSPDAHDNDVNYCYCKYTSNEGETVVYKVIFVFGRYDKEFMVEKILFK